MTFTNDPVWDAECHMAEQQAELDKLPKCDYCGEPITDEYYYEVDGIVCEECLNSNFRKAVEDFE